ncbi:MAG: UDP-N-acetylglucosamine 2-epimerase [Lachnospiraceae bacterium]|nr:UDP-N-acetylglucosamine 2-epimerase [Lachnospiraceae bacterium]
MKKKIAVITATRAEYGLLYPLIKELTADSFFDCQIIVTGTHLTEKYGHTVDYIVCDHIRIAHRIDILGEGVNDPADIVSKAIVKFTVLYRKEKYDGIIILGDRYELYGFTIPALLLNIPIIHIHGGEKTEGAVDEKIRHSITKMASIHFPSIEEYRKRIIQMGEPPQRVYAVGALGIDNITQMSLLEKSELEKKLHVNFTDPTALVTFHPVTLEAAEESKKQVTELMNALLESPLLSIITMPNSDAGGDEILDILLKYVSDHGDRFLFYKSLGQRNYLSCLKYVKLVIGNSSSGIIETASFHVPAINIGDRQKGRYAPENVIQCDCDQKSIQDAIALGLNESFRTKIQKYTNPYGDGHAAKRITKILKTMDWNREELIKKDFFDVTFEV